MLLSLPVSNSLEGLPCNWIGFENVVLCVAASVLPPPLISSYLEELSRNLVGHVRFGKSAALLSPLVSSHLEKVSCNLLGFENDVRVAVAVLLSLLISNLFGNAFV